MADGKTDNKKTDKKTIQVLRERAEKIWLDRRFYDRTLCDVYDYVMPFRSVTGLHVPDGRQTGDRRVDRLFDATAVKACYRFAGRLQTELTPIFSPFWSLEAGPILEASQEPGSDEVKQLNEELARVTKIGHGVINGSTFHANSQEAYADLYAGTAAMFMEDGPSQDEPIRFHVAPMAEIGLEEGPWGEVWHIFWKRKRKARDLPAMFPKAKWGKELKRIIENEDQTDVELIHYCYFDNDKNQWIVLNWTDKCDANDDPFYRKEYRTKPWLTPRFFKLPGEAYGRGPAQMAMPFIKTTNRARELALKAAAFALMGLWMRRDDGVFNPETSEFAPQHMWEVASTGGRMGATIARLPVPQDFDVSSIIIADEREQMKLALFDDTLPSDTGAVRSATEIAERMRRQSQDFLGVFGRFTQEIVVPLVRRVVDAMEKKGILKTNLSIDQLLTQVRVVAPIASGQQAAKVQAHVDWLQTISLLDGPEAATLAARKEELYSQLGRWMGCDEDFIRSEKEKEQLMQQAAEHLANQQIAAANANTPPEAVEQQVANGGGI